MRTGESGERGEHMGPSFDSVGIHVGRPASLSEEKGPELQTLDFVPVFVQTYRARELSFLLTCVLHCLGNLMRHLIFQNSGFQARLLQSEVQLLVVIAPCKR